MRTFTRAEGLHVCLGTTAVAVSLQAGFAKCTGIATAVTGRVTQRCSFCVAVNATSAQKILRLQGWQQRIKRAVPQICGF